jgi:mRNA interferase MazF
MGGFVKGDVLILPYPFDDFTQTKRRPGLVIATPKGFSPHVAQITSQVAADPYSISVDSTDFIAGGLKKSSFVRVNVLMTVNPAKVLYKAGVLSTAKLKEVTDRIVQMIET